MNDKFSDKWNYRFMEIALHISSWSKDPNTKVGSVVVGPDKEIRSQGYNGFPRGVDDDVPERHIRPTKYAYYEHSERNTIYNAVKFGARLEGCTLYVTMPPCADCARGIIQAGIKRVYYMEPGADKVRKLPNGNWRDTIADSFEMLKEAGVEVIALDRNLLYKNILVKAQNLSEKIKANTMENEQKETKLIPTPNFDEEVLLLSSKEYEAQVNRMRGCLKTLIFAFATIAAIGTYSVVLIKKHHDNKKGKSATASCVGTINKHLNEKNTITVNFSEPKTR